MARRFRGLVHLLASIIGLCIAVPAAHAQTFQQPNTDTEGNWSSAALWTPGVPTSGTSTALVFQTLGSNSNGYVFTNNIGPFTVNSLSFNNYGTGLFTVALGANPLTLDGTNPVLTNNGPGNNLISGAGGVVLNANTAVTGGGNGYLSISSIVSGTGGFTVNQTGNGIFALTGANTFTGGVTLNSGYLHLGNATALGDLFSSSLTINGGALRFASATALTIAHNITANSNLVVAGGSGALTGTTTPTITGVISGAGGLHLQSFNTGAGLILQGANTYSGATVLNSAIPLSAQSGAALTLSGVNGSISSTQPITIGKSTTLTLTNTAVATNSNRIPDAAPITMTGGSLSFTNAIANTETLGAITLTGLNRIGASSTSGVSTLTVASLSRVDNATLWISSAFTNQPALSGGAAPTNYPQFIVTGGLTNLAAGSGTGDETGIVPWIGATTGNPRLFVTYDAVNGLTVLPNTNTDYYAVVTTAAQLLAATNKNVTINALGTYDLGGGTVTVNSLVAGNQVGLTTIANGTINVFSGAVANWDLNVYNNVTLNFGSNTGYLNSSWAQAFSGTSSITGSAGLVISGTAQPTTFQNSTGNPFTGGLFLNGNGSYVGFNNENQLGDAAGSITFSGGALAWNLLANNTTARNIKINESNAVFSFNQTASVATAGTATAATVWTLSGTISGTGALIKEGVGALNLTGTNTYSGGTVLTAGTLQLTSDANLGAAGTKVTLNGGTLQPLAAINLSRPIDVNANTTINAANDLTLSGTITNVGSLYGTAQPTITKSGAGNLTISGNANQLSGNLTIAAGSVTLGGSGTNGGIPLVSVTTVGAGTTLTIDNLTTGYNDNRIGDLSAITLGGVGSVVSYLAPTTATSDPAERFGILNNTVAGGVFSVTGSAASGTVLRFNSLNVTAGLTLRGDDLGGITLGAGVTRILIDAFTSNLSVIPNVFFANTAGTGTSTNPAGYDLIRGVVLFTPTPVTGSSINNFAPDNVPITAAYTTNANTTAATGVQIYSLTLDGGSLVTMNGGNAASATNGNTPDGTMSISGGLLTSQNGAKTIDSATARTVSFGASLGTVTTTSDLTLTTNVELAGTSGLTKLGTGNLTLNGLYSVTGPLTVSDGTITFGQNATVNNPTGTGTVEIGTTTLTVNSTANTTFSGPVTGTTGSLTKTGTGVFTLSPSSAYTPTGTTNINGGTFVIGNANAVSIVNNYALNGGVIDLNGTAATTLATITGGTANGMTNSNTTTASIVTAAVPVDQSLALAFSGNVIVNKSGAGILTLTGTGGIANTTTTGVVNVNEGSLVLTGAGQGLGSGMSVNVANDAIFRFTFGTAAASGPFGTISVNGTGEWQNTGAQWSDPTVNRLAFNGGRINFTNTNTSGTFLNLNTVNGVSPAITSVASSITSQAITTNTVDLISNSSTAILPITLAQGTTASGVDLEINFRMTGANGFLKQGPGTLRLFGNASASTAPFTVSAGTLLAGGTGTGTGVLTVNGTGTLRGTGTSTGIATVLAGGKIGGGDPTTPLGTLTSTATVNIGQNGSLRTVGNSLSQSSQLNLTGASTVLNLNPGAGNTFGIDLISDTANPLVNGQAYTITLATVGAAGNIQLNNVSLSGGTNIAPSNFVLSSANFSAFNAVSLDVNGLGTSLILQFTPVPEPTTVLGLAALGLAGAGALRRRFRTKIVTV
jgi:autotransporter-associated beta strand protein